ncbi:hypothetical protein [Oceanobacillus piezotolerans]|uniref:hypothetical protein n=1 Tax=Oceanobacillus piezotolerans TaxID=2448030 RepID=UPI001314626D|nr:hypothetical protein [Oceanobacillus piezotolerans]
MDEAILGLLFILCLALGAGLGVLIQSFEIGGAIGLGMGLLILIFFRRNGKHRN